MKRRVKGLLSQKILYSEKKSILIHCASAGEYESIAHLVEIIQTHFPNNKIILSFFSPSGIDWIKIKEIRTEAYYLPFDLKADMSKFISQINPSFVIFSKKELWFNMLSILQSMEIPHFLVSTKFSNSDISLRSSYFTSLINSISGIFCVDLMTEDLLYKHNIKCTFLGDTRIDRIVAQSEQLFHDKMFDRISEKPIIIYGSLHRSDSFILEGIAEDSKYLHIVVPHNVNENEIDHFQRKLHGKADVYSRDKVWNKSILIVDKIGFLAKLYRYSEYTYIGGGFEKGIHNIIEPAVYENNIFIGPRHKKFPEALWLIENKAIIEINKNTTIFQAIQILGEQSESQIKEKLSEYINLHKNANQKIATAIMEKVNEIR